MFPYVLYICLSKIVIIKAVKCFVIVLVMFCDGLNNCLNVRIREGGGGGG